MKREEKIFFNINKQGFGIEIGPGYNPIAPKKDGYKVHTIDHMSKAQLVEKYKKNLAEKIINEDVDIDINFAGKFIGDIDRIYFNSKSEILYHPPKITEVLFNNKGEEIKKQDPKEIISNE